MEKQYYLYDENNKFVSTNYYLEQPENSTEIPPTVDTRFAVWNGTEWTLEIPENERLQMAISENIARKQQMREDGINQFMALSAEYDVYVANGYVTPEENLIAYNALKGVRDEVTNGEWAKGLIELEKVDLNAIGINLYNRLKNEIETYLQNN